MISNIIPILIGLHTLSAVVWVGGMFFAYYMLRPAAASLGQPVRCGLWVAVFHRFFRIVWAAIITLLFTGYLLMFAVFANFKFAPLYVHLMQGLGILMMLLFMHVSFGPWPKLRHALGEQHWEEGAKQLARIRRVVLVNTWLGIAVIVIASAGRYL